MVNTQPLEDYLKAIDLYNNGKKEEAMQCIANSVGVEEPTQYMRGAIDKLTKPNQAILALIINESRKD